MKKTLRILIPILAAVLILAAVFWQPRNAGKDDPYRGQEVTTLTVSAVGDCTLGRNQKTDYPDSWDDKYAAFGASYFLQNVSSVLLEDDLTVANLEGALTESAARQEYFYRQRYDRVDEKAYCHLGKPEYLAALKLGGVDAVSFANNHNIDYGLQGFTDTLDACDRYDMPVAYYDTVVRQQIKGLTVGIVSIDATYCTPETAETQLREGMGDLRRDCDLIIACMHWGKNYETEPNEEQQYLGHLCVDLGADMVIGCHAHILQGVERYRGRYIFYSLANFTYGGRAVPKEVETLIAQQTFTFVDGVLQVDDNVTLLPCWMSTREDINDFRPTLQTGAAVLAVLDKVNQRSELFSVRFDGDGRPLLDPEPDTALPPCDDPDKALTPDRVPEIIYILLNTEKS